MDENDVPVLTITRTVTGGSGWRFRAGQNVVMGRRFILLKVILMVLMMDDRNGRE